MGLDRVRAVKQRMGLAFRCPLIMVAGTDGKGSTCAMLEAILLQGGYRTGLDISPHFLDFNQRARINGEMAGYAALTSSFDVVQRARGDIDLTYLEFTTLANMHLPADLRDRRGASSRFCLPGRLDAAQRDRRRRVHRHQHRHLRQGLPGRHARSDRLREGRHSQAGETR